LLYGQCSVQITADDAATKIAQTYKLLGADERTGYIDTAGIGKIAKYRYIGFISGDTYEVENRKKAESYGGMRLSKTRLANKKKAEDIQFDVVSDGIGRNHVVVTITAEYEIPFGGFLSLIGKNPTQVYTATASAECLDVMDYYTTVNFAKRCKKYLDDNSTFVKTISSVMKLFTHDYD
jgi:hypothetical protein